MEGNKIRIKIMCMKKNRNDLVGTKNGVNYVDINLVGLENS